MNIGRKKPSLVLEGFYNKGKITDSDIKEAVNEYLKLEKNKWFTLSQQDKFATRADSIANYILERHKPVSKKYLRELKYFNKFWQEVFSPKGQRRIERFKKKEALISKKVKKEKIKTQLKNNIIYDYSKVFKKYPYLKKLDKKLNGDLLVDGYFIFEIPNSKLKYAQIQLKEKHKNEFWQWVHKKQYAEYKRQNNLSNFLSNDRQKFLRNNRKFHKVSHNFELPKEYHDSSVLPDLEVDKLEKLYESDSTKKGKKFGDENYDCYY